MLSSSTPSNYSPVCMDWCCCTGSNSRRRHDGDAVDRASSGREAVERPANDAAFTCGGVIGAKKPDRHLAQPNQISAVDGEPSGLPAGGRIRDIQANGIATATAAGHIMLLFVVFCIFCSLYTSALAAAESYFALQNKLELLATQGLLLAVPRTKVGWLVPRFFSVNKTGR